MIESDDQSPTAKEDEDDEVSRELLGDNSFSDEGDKGPIYLVYHSWEHYSSCRNIDGPHDGLPHIREVRPHFPVEFITDRVADSHRRPLA